MAELAKIVTGRATGSSTASRRAAPEPTPSRVPSGDALSDLEAELMSDLQASFASVRDVPPPPPPRAAPPPERPVPAPPSVPTPRMIAVEEEEIEIEEDLLQDDGLDDASSFAPPPAFVPPPPRTVAPEPPQLRRQLEEQPVPRLVPTTPIMQPVTNEAAPSADRPAERPLRTPRAPSTDRLDIAGMAMRPTTGPASGSASPGPATSTPPPTVRQPHSRWERPEPAKPQAAGASRFAPPTKTPPPQGQDDDDLFGAGGIFAEAADSDPNDGPFDAIDTASDYPDEDVRPTFREDDIEKLAKRRGSRAPLMILGVIGVVVLGGIAVAMLRPSGESDAPPPVIVANTDPTKITPEEPAATDDQNKLSYDRINSSDTNSDTTLLTPGDEQIADVGTSGNDNPITRVIIPAGPGFDQPALDASSADGPEAVQDAGGIGALAGNDAVDTDAAIGEELGPRRVRTVVVKPDGTIVESASAEEGAPAPTLPTQTAAAEPLPVPEAEPPPPRAVNDDTAAIAGTTSDGELAITPDATVDDLSAPANAPVPAPAAPQPEAPQVAAAPTNDTPPSEAARTTAAGGALVQVSSQRSEDAAMATFRDLQARYPSILGQYQPDVQRADIPDRGTFFRVRVGPFSTSDAQRLCNDLKSAGGDCIIAQR